MEMPTLLQKWLLIYLLLAYESNSTEILTFTDLQNGITIRKILENFVKNVTHLKCSSKRKYLGMFDCLTKFLLKDPESPERSLAESNDDTITKDLTYKMIKDEIHNVTSLMNKSSGKERIQKRKGDRIYHLKF